MKIIAICGSMRFREKMMEVSEKLELEGNCVLTPVFPPGAAKKSYTKQED